MSLDMSRGLHWIGHPGSLGWIVDRGEESVEDDIDVRVSTSMGGGRRVRVQRVRPLRAWSLQIPESHADEVRHLRSLLTSTIGPYQLITSHAQVSNVLTPERAEMMSLITPSAGLGQAGGWPIAAESGGGWTTTTKVNPSANGGAQGVVRVGPAPTPPWHTGRKVTVSAMLGTQRTAGAYVVLDWLDAAGAQIGAGVNGNAVTGMDGLRRSTATGTPPFGAVACRIGIVYAEVIGQPQVTWTDAPIEEWAPGEGADRMVVTASSRQTGLAVPDSYALRRSTHSFTLLETGPSW